MLQAQFRLGQTLMVLNVLRGVLVLALSAAAALGHAQEPGFAFGPEFRVNEFQSGDQRIPLVDSNASGQTVVIWQSIGQEAPGWTVYGQRFNENVVFMGGEIQINNYNIGSQDGQSLVVAPDGGFAVAWNGPDRSSTADVISVRRFGSDGLPETGDRRISDTTGVTQLLPRLGLSQDDELIVSWEASGSTFGFDILSRQADGLGNPTSPINTVNVSVDGAQRRGDLAVADDGSTIVVWQDALQDGSDWGVFVRCLDPQGLGPAERQVNQFTAGQQSRPRVARAKDGRFSVVWQDNRGLSSFVYRRIMARQFDAQCQPLGPEIQINRFDDGIQDQPAIAVDNAGHYIFVWQSFPEDFEQQGIYARRLGRDGQFLSDEFKVSQEIEAFQDFPDVTALPDEGYLFVWESAGQDESGYGIFARRFAGPTGAALNVLAGADQATPVGTPFDQAVVIEVRDQWGQPRADERLLARSPADAAGVVFSNDQPLIERRTDAQGLAVFNITANALTGVHQLRIEAPDSGLERDVELQNLGPLFGAEAVPVPMLESRALFCLLILVLVMARRRL